MTKQNRAFNTTIKKHKTEIAIGFLSTLAMGLVYYKFIYTPGIERKYLFHDKPNRISITEFNKTLPIPVNKIDTLGVCTDQKIKLDREDNYEECYSNQVIFGIY